MRNDTESNHYLQLLHKTVDTVYVAELEQQLEQYKEIAHALHENHQVVDVVTKHLSQSTNSRIIRMAMLLEATYQSLVTLTPTEENVNSLANTLRRGMSVLNLRNN